METEKETLSDVLPSPCPPSGKEVAAVVALASLFLNWDDITLETFTWTLAAAVCLRFDFRRNLIIDLDDEWVGFRIGGKRVRVVWMGIAELARGQEMRGADLYYLVGADETSFGVISQKRLASLPEDRRSGNTWIFKKGDLFPANEFIKWALEQEDPC